MNILITGGAGYIGSATCFLLKKKKLNPIIVDKLIYKNKNIITKNCIFYKKNISDLTLIKKIIKKYHIKSVIHFAAYKNVEESILKPKLYYKNNYLISKNFIKCCKDSGVENFIFSSTAAVYGNVKKKLQVGETSILRPISMYGLSKKKVEDFLIKTSDKKFKYFSLRYFNVIGADKFLRYGPIDTKSKSLTNNLFKSLTHKKKFNIFGNKHKTFDGTPVRDFIHVDDLALIHYKSLKYLIKHRKNQITNCGYGIGYSVKQVAEIFKSSVNKQFSYKYVKKRNGDISYMVASTKKINKILNLRFKNNSLKKMIISELNWKKKELIK